MSDIVNKKDESEDEEVIFDEKKEEYLSKTTPAFGDSPFYPQTILTNDIESNQNLPLQDSGYYTDGRSTNRGYHTTLSFANLFKDIKNILKNNNKV